MDGMRLTICATCGSGAGEGQALADRVRGALPAEWSLRLHDCLGACARPVALAVEAPGRATYLFAGVRAGDAEDLLAFTRLYAAAPDGWIEDARPAGRLRHCLRGRIPA